MAREESMITKKKTKPVTYEELIQKKKKKKKKKAREAENEPASEAQSHTEVKNEGLVKHKRKHYLTEEMVPDPGEDHVAESPVKKKKKKKKLKFKGENITDAPISAENEEMGKNNLSQNCLVPNDENAESESFKKKRKKKKDKQILHLTEEVDQEELEMESADKSSMLKKKKRVSATQENVLISTLSETIERDTEEDNNDIKKKKKKKKRKKKAEIIQSDQSENKTEKEECGFVEHNITSIDNKRKKKKKLDRALDSEEGTLSKNTIEADKCTMKNSKKRPTPECAVPKEVSTSKKKKSAQVKQEGAQEVNEDDPDVEIVSVKKGNKDEVKIDKIRRQALQDEVDRESGKIKSENVGQWQTATFDNPEQKMKFLRLMGGFKKSSQLTPLSPAVTEKPIMALSRTGEETLKQNLLSEFEKAIDLKQNRGMGLGFQPTTKKTFCIDKNKSTSIKFDY